jgi:GNAT superfamily N-acetyltransferase
MTFTIRPLALADYDQWLPLRDGYNAFCGRSGPAALAPEITNATSSRLFSPAEPMHALVAASDGQLLGLVHFLYHRSTISIPPVCCLQDLFTAAAARGRGVATALIHAVNEEARRAGASRVYWHTHETNHTARRVYDQVAENSGFIVYRQMF